MTKDKLEELLLSLDIQVNEGATSIENANSNPRIVFWDYIWEDQIASGQMYEEIETFQISFFSKTPRHPKLIELRNKLRNENLHPTIYHEYVQEDKIFHSYFSLDVSIG